MPKRESKTEPKTEQISIETKSSRKFSEAMEHIEEVTLLDDNGNIAYSSEQKISLEKTKPKTKSSKKAEQSQIIDVEKQSSKIKKVKMSEKKVVNEVEGAEDEVDIWKLKPEKIIGASDLYYDGEITFGIKFRGHKRIQIVPAKIAHVKCPQLVIAFYEQRLFLDYKKMVKVNFDVSK